MSRSAVRVIIPCRSLENKRLSLGCSRESRLFSFIPDDSGNVLLKEWLDKMLERLVKVGKFGISGNNRWQVFCGLSTLY